jgi:hypothetical protein
LEFYIHMKLNRKTRWVKDNNKSPETEYSALAIVVSRDSVIISLVCSTKCCDSTPQIIIWYHQPKKHRKSVISIACICDGGDVCIASQECEVTNWPMSFGCFVVLLLVIISFVLLVLCAQINWAFFDGINSLLGWVKIKNATLGASVIDTCFLIDTRHFKIYGTIRANSSRRLCPVLIDTRIFGIDGSIQVSIRFQENNILWRAWK